MTLSVETMGMSGGASTIRKVAWRLIAETALHNDLGVVHVDRDFERIAEVRSLVVRRLG